MFSFHRRSMHVSRRYLLGTVQIGLLAGSAALLAGAAAPAPQTSATSDAVKLQQYQKDVLPVLQENCLRCHGGMNHRGGYSMATRAMSISGGHHGIAIVPGKPDESLVIKLIGPGPYPDDIKPMPLKGKLTDTDIATLRKWVADGAVMQP